MADDKFPPLDAGDIDATKQAVHAYARIAGAWCKAYRNRRKHWWHASLRPSLRGLTTGVIYAKTNFEIELDLAGSELRARIGASTVSDRLTGQPSAQLAATVSDALRAADIGWDGRVADEAAGNDTEYAGYSADQAKRMNEAIASIAAALEDFRATIREETSPIQVWPHHFDLSMIWLPGPKIPGQDVADEESADKQMNFGFAFGDEAIREPYCYVTAYPLPETLPDVHLPTGTTWHSEGFSGAVLLYRDLAAMKDPAGYLLDLWSGLMEAAREHLCA